MTFGSWGEDTAVGYLKKKGYIILEKNFRSKIGELDIIARYENTIVFVEVKTRNSLKFGLPCEAITKNKMKHIKRMVNYYTLINNTEDLDLRIDVIEILVNEGVASVHHIENAF